ncbi:MAG: hypothetical protein ACM3NO_08450 [Deltaproteobacteria bacterium]|nr:hypothetical protein [Candidatus Polarisedimenticolia bacterium]
MHSKLLVLAGTLLILLGIAALIYPDVPMPAKRSEIQIGPERLKLETRRVVTIPAILSGIAIVCGGGLIFVGARRS